ncbi:conserved hypothetical protein, partial [Ricinus communis]
GDIAVGGDGNADDLFAQLDDGQIAIFIEREALHLGAAERAAFDVRERVRVRGRHGARHEGRRDRTYRQNFAEHHPQHLLSKTPEPSLRFPVERISVR